MKLSTRDGSSFTRSQILRGTDGFTLPGGIIRKEDVSIAKNYLDREEFGTLNRIVNAYIEFAELRALQCIRLARPWTRSTCSSR
jgi:hypothetical protein